MKINGEKLSKMRQAANVNRSELATAADLSHVRIWQLETSEVSNVNENVAKAMAKKLKCHTVDFEA